MRLKKRVGMPSRFIWLAVFVVLLSRLVACGETGPEAAIRAKIDLVQKAAEEKIPRRIVAHVADDFSGNHGLNKQRLRALLAGVFLRYKNINVLITSLEVNIDPQHPILATMQAVVLVTGAEHILPENGRVFQVSGDWRLFEGEWELQRATWQ